MTDKPPYRIPAMDEIRAVPSNGLTVASTFAGCGGSSLGYRWAGLDVVWANEFVEAARDTYAANFPGTPIDPRDVREVQPGELLEAAGLGRGELDVLDGSPPCTPFSMSGKREKGWGKVRDYSETRQRDDDLFLELARLVDGVRPRAFVAENVRGLVIGKAKGYFKLILRALKACGYRVQARVLDAQWLGVPQRRARVIFVGMREDLGLEPALPPPLPYRYTLQEACPWIARAVHDAGGQQSLGDVTHDPCPTVVASRNNFKVESKAMLDGYALAEEWDKLRPGEKSDRYQNLVRAHPDKPCPTVTAIGGGSPGTACVTHPTERRKFTMAELRRICGFPDDFVLTGTYAQQWERLGRSVPPPMMYHVARAVARTLGAEENRCR